MLVFVTDWRRQWQPTSVFLPGEWHGRRSLAGYSLRGRKSRTRLSDSAQHRTVLVTNRWELELWPRWPTDRMLCTQGNWSEGRSLVSSSSRPQGLYHPCNSPGQNTGVASLSLLQGIFPSQGSNPGLPHCRQILYQLSHWGSPWILERQPIPSPGDPPDPGIELGSPTLQADSLPTEHRWAVNTGLTDSWGGSRKLPEDITFEMDLKRRVGVQ